MFEILEDAAQIAAAQRKFEDVVRHSFSKKAVRNIGFPGDTYHDATIWIFGNYWYHTHHDREAKTPRKVNWFGVLTESGSLDISVEINTVYEGTNARVAGYFARDGKSGEICVFHTGKVGGGTPGVGKMAFLQWSHPELVTASRSEGNAVVGVLLMRINSNASVRPVLRYVDTIVAFKEAVRKGETQTTKFKKEANKFRDFFSEASGRRQGRRRSEIDYISRHGDIVDALHLWRKRSGLNGGRIVKNPLIDLGIEKRGKLHEIYEVKSSADRQELYTAIGQTLVHGVDPRCRRAIVLPSGEHLKQDIENALNRLSIGVMRFKLTKNTVRILPKR